jgi:hypothetical protein
VRARALVVLLLLLAGCPPPKPVERPYPPPRIEDVLAALRARSEKLQSLSAGTRVEFQQPGQHGKVGVDLLVARGGRLRFEATVPLQGVVATLVADGRTFAMLDTKNNRYYTGAANACNVARLIQIELEPEEVVQALLGEAPDLEQARPLSIEWDPTHGGRELVSFAQPDGGREKLFVDGRDNHWDLLAVERTDAGGHVKWHIDNDGWADHGGLRLPQRTHVAQPPIRTELWIKFKDVDPNFQPKEGVFQLPPPPGIPVETVRCGGATPSVLPLSPGPDGSSE